MKRRDFLKLSSVSLIPLVPVHLARADERPRLPVDNPQAKALEYVEQSAVEGQYCNNCIHANGDLSADWMGCNLFPGHLVSGPGWCKVWAPR